MNALRLIGERPARPVPIGAGMFMDRPLLVKGRVIWPWRMTKEQRESVQPLREFFNGMHLDRVIDARVSHANARRK